MGRIREEISDIAGVLILLFVVDVLGLLDQDRPARRRWPVMVAGLILLVGFGYCFSR